MKNSIYIVMVAVAAIVLMVCTVRAGQSADTPAPVPNPELGRTERAYISRLLHESYNALPAEEKTRWPELSEALENLVYQHQDGQVFECAHMFYAARVKKAYEDGCPFPFVKTLEWAPRYYFGDKDRRSGMQQAAYEQCVGEGAKWNSAMRLLLASEWLAQDMSNATARACTDAEIVNFLADANPGHDEIGAVYSFVRFCSRMNDNIWDGISKRGIVLDPWLKAMFEANEHYSLAWEARGTGFANTVTEEGWRIYETEIAKALQLCAEAYRLRPDLPQSCTLAAASSMGSAAKCREWAKRARTIRQESFAGFSSLVFTLRPRWGGNTRLMTRELLPLLDEPAETMAPVFALEHFRNDVFGEEGGWSGCRTYARFVETNREKVAGLAYASLTNSLLDRACHHAVERAHAYGIYIEAAYLLGDWPLLDAWCAKADAEPFNIKDLHNTVSKRNFHFKEFRPYVPIFRLLPEERRQGALDALKELRDGGNKDAKALIAILKPILDEVIGGGKFEPATVEEIKTLAGEVVFGSPGAHDATVFLDLLQGMKIKRPLESFKLSITAEIPESYQGMAGSIRLSASWRGQVEGKFRQASAGCAATHGRFAQGLDDFEWRKDCRVMTFSMDITGSAAVFRANGEIVKEATLDAPISAFRETSFGISYPAQYPDRMKITNVTIETR